MKDGDHLIWSNHHLDLDDWRDALLEDHPDATESELYQMMYDLNDDYLADERINLNIQMERPILIIGDIERWNGRVSGYKEIPSGNIKDCLYADTDYSTWYVDRKGDLRCDAIHHDGRNHYLYRAYKPGATEAQIERLKGKIYDGVATRTDIIRITQRLGDDIGKVYGWKFPQKEKKLSHER